ncbi:MAG: hypothetical protein JJU42_13770 [Rhodobacteraceae bacterium]|nr:hypothetical protein [Paracoccaceae bacterium]
MKPAEQLAQFVQQGLQAGHPPDTLRAALLDAGWSDAEVDGALAGWADAGLGVPVPRPRGSVSARDAAVYGLLFVALLSVTWNLVSLGFRLIDTWLPDPLRGTGQDAWTSSSMRWSMAALIVVGPLFVALHLHAERATTNKGLRRSPMRRRVGALGLFLAALVLLGDAVGVVYALLSGDMTAQFIAKAALVAAVALLVMLYFRRFLDDGG